MISVDFVLSKFKIYWEAKRLLSWLLHYFLYQRIFSLKFKWIAFKRKSKYLLDIIRSSQKDILISLILCGGIYLILFYFYGFNIFDFNQTSDVYDTILGTVAGIGGIVIALYSAGLTSIGTSIYSRFPSKIKVLLAREPIINVFVKYLAFMTFFSIVFLVLRFLGFKESKTVIILVLFQVGIGLFAIINLGQRLLYLSDPAMLSETLVGALKYWFSEARVGGFQWTNPSFQDHYGTQAKNAVNSLNLLTDILEEDHLAAYSLLNISDLSSDLLVKYQKIKRRIPSSSKWHPTMCHHSEWYKTEDIKMETAKELGYLQPMKKNDLFWYERELLQINVKCILKNLKSSRFDVCNKSFNDSSQILQKLVENGEAKFAVETLIDSYNKIKIELNAIDFKKMRRVNQLELLSFSERLAIVGTELILLFFNFLKNDSHEITKNRVKAINWHSHQSIFKQGLPFFLHERLEWFYKCIKFERYSDGRRVTPDWYIESLVCLSQAQKFEENLTALLKLIEKPLFRLDKSSPDIGNLWIIASVTDRYFEQVRKIEKRFHEAESYWNELIACDKTDGLPWPKLDLRAIQNGIFKQRKNAAVEMARIAGLLISTEKPNEYQDYGGKFLHFTGEHLIDCLTVSVPNIDKDIFLSFFHSSLIKFEQLRKETQNSPSWLKDQTLLVAVAPIIDLMSISGYALLLSGYPNNSNIWKTVKDTWDLYLKENRKGKLEMLATLHHFPQSGFILPFRGFIRAHWQKKVVTFLNENVKIQRHWYQPRGALGFQENILVDSRNPVIRAFIEDDRMISNFEGSDIFIDMYLKAYEEATKLNFSTNEGRFAEAVQREEQLGYRFSGKEGD